ncbi:MAG: ABC transporter permease [Desulfobacterales bacterium]|jgi:peptide/nickel transport system permease protein
MLSYLSHRLAAAAFMIVIAGTFVFFIIHLLPGDPVMLLLGDGAADPEVVATMRQKLQLDRPLHVQYIDWAGGVLRLDLGTSLQTDLPVVDDLARRIPRSLELILAATLLSVLLGVPLGVVGGRHPDSPAGWATSTVAVMGFSSPVFVIGIVLIILFSLNLMWFPSSGYVPMTENPMAHFRFLVLPALTLGIGFMGVVIRITRSSFMDVLSKDFVRTARAKGLSNPTVIYRHALLNSLIPVISVLGVRIGNLLGGTVIIESLFDWPGLSSLLVRSCYDRDYPVIQGALLSIFVMFVLISLSVDLLQGLLDPKRRLGGRQG